jgi:methylaspartate ammonia-lyase
MEAGREQAIRTNSSCNEVGILAMCCVPVASVKNANQIVAHGGQGLEKTDESMFIVDL